MRYHNITKDDMLNGDGLRAVLRVAGCTHKCKGCHNPVTWDIEGGIPFDDAAKEELFEAIKPDYISGVTFSGGDPLHPANHVEVAVLAKGPSTITSQYFTTSSVLISSQQNPVYSQIVLFGNVSLISFAKTATSTWFAG